jgi:hypothetical protein
MNLQVTCKKFTVGVEVDRSGVIRDAAPVVRKFIGQPLDNLVRWFRKFGDEKVLSIERKI